jgi:hypothetical protein
MIWFCDAIVMSGDGGAALKKYNHSVELPGCGPIPILHEDWSAPAIDGPRDWLLVLVY